MAGVYKLEITETEADLKQRLCSQKTASDKERIQLLYLLKTEQATTIQAAAALLGRHRVTLQEWLRLYRRGGLEAMLEHKPRTGTTAEHSSMGTRGAQPTLTPTRRL
jgi:transposase-like protein